MFRQGIKFFRTRVKLVKVMGRYYFKEFSPEYIEKIKSTFLVRKDDIKSEKELVEFLAKEQCIRDPYDNV